MFDAALPTKAYLVGGFVAAAVMALATLKSPRPWRHSACWSWAIGAGILAASGTTDQWPHWPALEDRARFLTLLLPLCLAVETVAAMVQSRRVAWIVRLGLAAVVTPILLHNTVYLADLSGPNSAEWTPIQTTLIVCGLAAVLALVWALLSNLQSRISTPAVTWVLILDALAAAVTVMLSGYYGGGLLGLGLAGALTGATLTSYVVQRQSPTSGSQRMSVIGIFTVLLMGRFFGNLPTSLAACLLFAPLLAWIVELPRLRTLPSNWRTAARLACVALPLIVVVILAQRAFVVAFAAPSRSAEPSATRDLFEK